MPPCGCRAKPEFFRADDRHPDLRAMSEVAHKRHGVRLLRCDACGQHWQVDVWDKYQPGLAIRVPSPEAWPDFDDVPVRKQALEAMHGGLGKVSCAWSGCSNLALADLAYCPDCAYEKAGIRE